MLFIIKEKKDPVGCGNKSVVGQVRFPSYNEKSLFMVDHSLTSIMIRNEVRT